ncbi:MAG: hypothetical protein JXA21_15285 [Anaerolineae bacterium]|nr:hypothetical protein [Anaerolineae bacterium]
MGKVKEITLEILRFLGITLLVDLGLLILVSLSCLIGTRCTATAWSERMFWVGLGFMIIAAPVAFAALSTGRAFNNPMTMGMDNQIAVDIIESERQGLDKRTMFALRMGLIGTIGIVLSALIDTYFGR